MKILDRFNPVLKDINTYFSFLFDQGFQIRYVNFEQRRMIFWNAILESSKCLIHIFQERSDIFLTIAPPNAITPNNVIEIQNQIGIQPMIYYLSAGKKFIGLYERSFYRDRKKQFKVLASLLEENLNQITPFFGNYEFRQYQRDLLDAQKEYNDLLIKRYVSERQPREKIEH